MSTASLLQRFAAASRAAANRRFAASAPEAVAEAPEAEVVRLASQAPVLVQLPDRQFGASAVLQSHLIPGHAGSPEHLSVVRHAFAAHDAATGRLADIVAPLGEGHVAVLHRASDPHTRLIVDEYQRGSDGHYRLQRVGTDLCRFLSLAGVRVSHVPNVGLPFNSMRANSAQLRQSSNEVLMVAPTAFGFNDQAAQDNHFMHSAVSSGSATGGNTSVTLQALKEFAGLHHELTEEKVASWKTWLLGMPEGASEQEESKQPKVAGVRVSLFQHSQEHGTPDAVFPNNWFSTHPAGEAAGGVQKSSLVFYPLKCPNRQKEKREDIKEVLQARGYETVWDMSASQQDRQYFEGTGVLVLDRVNGVAYVNISERAHPDLAQRWGDELGYKEVVTFRTVDPAGADVYHTNVMMAIGTDVAVVCAEAVPDEKQRKHLLERLGRHHKVITITNEQMGAMCGNILELEDGRGLPVMAMSTQAHNAFTPEQRRDMRKHVAALHHAPLDTIEYIGGGGVRCSLAELF